MTAPSLVYVAAPAKINLYLGVGPLRPDGYHELATVFQALDFVDELVATPQQSGVRLVLGQDSPKLPVGPGNLAVRAARSLKKRRSVKAGVRLLLDKHIPVAGGMAGGSADAAAALVACNLLWDLQCPQSELMEIAAELGSDVPFSLHGGTALGSSRGEVLTPVLTTGTFTWVVAESPSRLSTPDVYARYDQLNADRDIPSPAVPTALLAGLRRGDVADVGACIHNDLQQAAISMRPELDLLLEAGRDYGALGAMVSGSGPTCVFLAENEEHGAEVAVALSMTGLCSGARIATGPAHGVRVLQVTE